MLAEEHTAHFRAFGYAVLKDFIAATELDRLTSTFERAMQRAEPMNQFGDAGSLVFPFGEDAGAAVAALVGHPPLIDALRALLGAEPLYVGSFLMQSADDTPWHTTGVPGEGPETVRVIIYLDPSREREGALHLIPGSHCHDYSRALFQALGYWEGRGTRLRGDPRRLPAAISVPTDLRDVLIWYTRLWHASFKRDDGKPRRGVYLSYVPDPGRDPVAAEKLRRIAQASRSTRRPYLYGNELRALNDPRIAAMVQRLKELAIPNVIEE